MTFAQPGFVRAHERVPGPIAISAGDPCGVGPNVSLCAAHAARLHVRSAIFGDIAQLRAEAIALGYEPTCLVECDERSLNDLPDGAVGLVDTGRLAAEVIKRHAPSPEAGAAQLGALERAARSVQAGQARALVTGPTSKAAIAGAGYTFVGQTEFLAGVDGRDDDAVTMMFLGPKLRVALVTTHLAIGGVPAAVTRARVARTVRHLAEALLLLDAHREPTRARVLWVVGLNPHAGEEGLFGREELDVIEPALAALRAEPLFVEARASALQRNDPEARSHADDRITLVGPVPAESTFRAVQRGEVDGVVAMFHDQATIASKLLDWGAAVNTTWGLSFVRTSVDHGVAYDAARHGQAEPAGMIAALEMAVRLTAGAESCSRVGARASRAEE